MSRPSAQADVTTGTCTGYGNQTRLFTPRLRDDGHEVSISAFYGLAGAQLEWGGIPVYPVHADAYLNDVLAAHAIRQFGGGAKDGLVITLMDIWVLNPPMLQRVNVAHWCPVDHEPVPPMVLSVLQQGGGHAIAMSRFGQQQFAQAGVEALYVPHGVPTSIFAPMDRAEARAKLGFPQDAFVVGVVSANKGNPSRKAFPQMFEAYARFLARRKPSDPRPLLYIHSEAHGVFQGVNLYALLEDLRIPPENVALCDQYQSMLGFSDFYMNLVYNAMDVHLMTSFGEGVGIPCLEAQACGTPTILTNFSASKELCGAGWKVGGQRFYTPQGAWQVVPSISEIAEALEHALEASRSPKRARQLREQARTFAMAYDADHVYQEYWKPTLATLEERISQTRQSSFSDVLTQQLTAPVQAEGERRTPSGLILPTTKSPFLGAKSEAGA